MPSGNLFAGIPGRVPEELFERLYDRMPKEFLHMRQLLLSNLWRTPQETGLAPER